MTTFSGSLAPAGSAQIYAFPPRGRFALANQDAAMDTAAVRLTPSVKLASGSGWYHEAAIVNAARADWTKK